MSALQNLKPGKEPGPGFILPELILLAGSEIMFCSVDSSPPACATSKNPRSGEEL